MFTEISKFVNKYNALPSKEALSIEMNGSKNINEDEYKKVTDIISTLNKEPVNIDWLRDTTEKFCKDRAIHNAILGGIQIIDGKDKRHTPEVSARNVIKTLCQFLSIKKLVMIT